MVVRRDFAEPERFERIVRAAFGRGRRLTGVERLRGGSKKGVYRLTLDDESTAVSYVWDATENYWPARPNDAGEDRADPFSDASGIELFQASQAQLTELGVRTPAIYWCARSRTDFPADIALVEDVRGGTLEARLEQGTPGMGPVLALLGESLAAMHQHGAPRWGKLAWAASGGAGDGPAEGPADGRSCEQIVLDRALADLAESAGRVSRVAAARERLEDLARELRAAVQPRTRYGLIHGELGPDHVLIDRHGRPVMIDIEGAMYCDIEWEHAFLQLRFGEHYRQLRADNLDQQRMRFYRLALHLSLIAGPLRLLDGDFPDRELMRQIAEHNIDRALAFLP
jgi:aminoglycoside phosphotransferase (APT) family kinase protein